MLNSFQPIGVFITGYLFIKASRSEFQWNLLVRLASSQSKILTQSRTTFNIGYLNFKCVLFSYILECSSTLDTIGHNVQVPPGFSVSVNNIATVGRNIGIPDGNIRDEGSIRITHDRIYTTSTFGELKLNAAGASAIRLTATFKDGTTQTARVWQRNFISLDSNICRKGVMHGRQLWQCRSLK